MKNLNKTLSFFILTGAVSNIAQAHECLQDNWIFRNVKTTLASECKPGDKLELSQTSMSYPQMHNNPYHVEYWKGSYTRDATVTKTYLHEVVDRCSNPDRVVLSETVPFSETVSIEFSVDNPNLHDDVTATYDLVPMTDAEAQKALGQALLNCRK